MDKNESIAIIFIQLKRFNSSLLSNFMKDQLSVDFD